ncbi:hypothetical protein [Methylobacterium sp. GC_Met_2]|uniref:hypothetical protein n=1 Tax=Methylobacterium sp. GC_Met_2 TaxID=2937376 RepID=UPI00226B16B8|nr:hypothetical protein [Methylobacterium sp. GC_Met_2]
MIKGSEAREGAYAGQFVDVTFDWSRRHFVAHLSFPLQHLDGFLKEVGIPPHPADRGELGHQIPVVLLACYGPTGAIPDHEVIAASAIDTLIRLAGQGRLTGYNLLDLQGRLQRLDDARARAAGLTVPPRAENA